MKITLKAEEKPTLTMDGTYGDKLTLLLDKLNHYRTPEQQITKLYNEFKQEVPLTYRIKSDLTLYYEIPCSTNTPLQVAEITTLEDSLEHEVPATHVA